MSCHNIGHALNYVQQGVIEQFESGNLDVNTARTLLLRCIEAVNFCDGNWDEACDFFDKHYCSKCMTKVPHSKKLYYYFCHYQMLKRIREYAEKHRMVGTRLCESCFDEMLTTLGFTSEEIEKEKEYQK